MLSPRYIHSRVKYSRFKTQENFIHPHGAYIYTYVRVTICERERRTCSTSVRMFGYERNKIYYVLIINNWNILWGKYSGTYLIYISLAVAGITWQHTITLIFLADTKWALYRLCMGPNPTCRVIEDSSTGSRGVFQQTYCSSETARRPVTGDTLYLKAKCGTVWKWMWPTAPPNTQQGA